MHFSTTERATIFTSRAEAKGMANFVGHSPALAGYAVEVVDVTRYHPEGSKRRKNPAPRHDAEIEAAAKLQSDFSGHSPGNVDAVTVPENKVFTPVGKLSGVLYDTVRDGKDEKYIHRFRRKSRPLLAASSDGTELKILGGGFRFTEAGIVDE
jgi:hypothetical protein